MDLRDLTRFAVAGWTWIVLCVALGAGLAVAYLWSTPAVYQASAAVVVLANGPQSITEAEQGVNMSAQLANTVATIIDSPAVLESVSTDSLSVSELADMTTAEVPPQTSSIDIVVQSTDPDRAASVANGIASSASEIVPEMLGDDGEAGKLPVIIEVIRPAAAPAAPFSPNTQGVLVIGIALGLCAGLAIAIGVGAARPRKRAGGVAKKRPRRNTKDTMLG
ncbi:YveK family protein [Demequina sp. SO4-18]|uniref:YveK family protein n=1 Tax=Demequina sp. SO4-18 TaxID=3401026 RepID=UPI003B595934